MRRVVSVLSAVMLSVVFMMQGVSFGDDRDQRGYGERRQEYDKGQLNDDRGHHDRDRHDEGRREERHFRHKWHERDGRRIIEVPVIYFDGRYLQGRAKFEYRDNGAKVKICQKFFGLFGTTCPTTINAPEDTRIIGANWENKDVILLELEQTFPPFERFYVEAVRGR